MNVPEYKYCPQCKTVKAVSCWGKNNSRYDGLQNHCKECRSQHYYANPIPTINRTKEQYRKDPDRTKQRVRLWRVNNTDKVRQYRKNWCSKNGEYKRIWQQNRRKHEIWVRIRDAVSANINHSLHYRKNGASWEGLVGYSLNDLMKHLEKQFTDGMTWENYGQWHIDHRIPVSAFNYENINDLDFKRCWSLRNLRPMWAIENIRKGNRVTSPFQPSLLLPTTDVPRGLLNAQ